jgi:hypothetical protein
MATTAFDSTNFDLTWPIFAPDAKEASIILSRNGYDISGGDGVTSDATSFDRIPFEAAPGRRDFLYWQHSPAHGQRVVIVDSIGGWRGDRYFLFTVEDQLSQVDFMSSYRTSLVAGWVQPERFQPPLALVLNDFRWSPPLILKTSGTGEFWVIDQGQFEAGFAPWTVYILGSEGLTSQCRIDFASGSVGLAEMPKAVRHFASLVNEALGPGNDEGTLQPTARIRVGVDEMWAILSERPWALKGAPYNTRAEVDSGLKEWARDVTSRADLLHRIAKAYDTSERELALFYVQKFDLKPKDAQAFSAFAIDQMLRSYFVFSSQNSEPLHDPTSPWPEKVR